MKAIRSDVPEKRTRPRHLEVIFWCVAVLLAILRVWASRNDMNEDSVSYLDIGDAYLRGDWKTAVNACWSPLYSWFLGSALRVSKPSPYWEFPTAHLVNFVVFLGLLASFVFFWNAVLECQRARTAQLLEKGLTTLPEWCWVMLGYSLFLWTSLKVVGLSLVSPDLCVAAFVYLASGLVVRIRMRRTSWLAFVLLGVVLGFAYLAKAVMFLLAFVFLGVSLFSAGDVRKAIPRVAVALMIFLSIASPFVIILSRKYGRLTFGDTGKLNYAWHVNQIGHWVHWQGEPPGSGSPKHPTRKILTDPDVFEYATPVGGTYPPRYDPSYWNEGLAPFFSLKAQMRTLFETGRVLYHVLFDTTSGLAVGACILFLTGRRRRSCLKDIAEGWYLLVPAITTFGFYCLVYLEPRYIGAFILLFWVGLLFGLRVPDSQDSKRLTANVSAAIAMTIWLATFLPVVSDLQKFGSAGESVHPRVAEGLSRLGVKPGDRVATLGTIPYYWARLARVKIVAEVPNQEVDKFWAGGPSVQLQVLRAFARTEPKVIVASPEAMPGHQPEGIPQFVLDMGWQKIGGTDYYVHSPKEP